MARRLPAHVRPLAKARGYMYSWSRTLGNLQPWLELNPRKIIRRHIHRWLGRIFSRALFGRGLIARMIRMAGLR